MPQTYLGCSRLISSGSLDSIFPITRRTYLQWHCLYQNCSVTSRKAIEGCFFYFLKKQKTVVAFPQRTKRKLCSSDRGKKHFKTSINTDLISRLTIPQRNLIWSYTSCNNLQIQRINSPYFRFPPFTWAYLDMARRIKDVIYLYNILYILKKHPGSWHKPHCHLVFQLSQVEQQAQNEEHHPWQDQL